MLDSSLKYENTIIKHNIYAQEQTFIAVFIKCLLMPINAGTMLYKGRIDYLLMLN